MHKKLLARFGLATIGVLAGALLAAGPASASPTVLKPPALPGVAPLPGPVAAHATPSPTMGLLRVSPEQGVAGTPITISGTHLPPLAAVELTWSTANVTWVVDPEPDTVNYLGRSATNFAVVIDKLTTSASGSFTVKLDVPDDWGGIHDIYAVVGGVEEAHGGFVVTRSVTVSPTSGPIGTPITITYTGLGSELYPGGGALLWDNHYVGEMTGNWTRGTARVTIRAAGPVGPHLIEVGDAISFLYLNLPQSPLPFANGATATFTTTADDGPPAPSIDWPAAVAPTVSARTTLAASGLATSSGVDASLSATSGPVDERIGLTATGLTPGAPVEAEWSTVVGSRVDCTSVCWSFVTVPLASATAQPGTTAMHITVPDGLGGWHVVQLSERGKVVAQVPFYVKESLVGRGVSSVVVKQGQPFTVHLKGVGWTQLDNTVAVDYDNSYVGYGCGFNSNGDVVLRLHATGAPGTHIIDIYPMLYTASPSFANTPYGMVPVLSYAEDDPALALGYQLPAFRLAITVVA